jgi:hypothetical protein
MPTELTLYRRPVNTVFDLLGDKENDITYAIGWALAQSDRLTRRLLADVFPRRKKIPDVEKVLLQEGISGAGFTDIEILAGQGTLHLIIEAKRGWSLPAAEQLTTYAERTKIPPTAMLVTAEASPEFVKGKLPTKVGGNVPVHYRSWRQVERLVRETANGSGSHAEKRLLRELASYLRGLMTMQNVRSNLVYVVSLGGDIEGSGISFRDVVVKHNTYFCPVGGRGRWPKEAPNYLGFRFDGELQQIRHVESYTIKDDNHAGFPPLKGKVDWPTDPPHWNFKLGPPIVPSKRVRTGNLYATLRVWAAIDLLLTCDSVSEARDKTYARFDEAGEVL